METERITDGPIIEPTEAPRAVARSTRMFSARLPLDLHTHLKRVAAASGMDVTLALCGILQTHRDGTLNRSAREAQTRVAALEAQVDALKERLGDLTDLVVASREERQEAAARTEQLLSSLVDLIRNAVVEEVDEEGGRRTAAPVAEAAPAPSSPQPANRLPPPVRYRP